MKSYAEEALTFSMVSGTGSMTRQYSPTIVRGVRRWPGSGMLSS